MSIERQSLYDYAMADRDPTAANVGLLADRDIRAVDYRVTRLVRRIEDWCDETTSAVLNQDDLFEPGDPNRVANLVTTLCGQIKRLQNALREVTR